jgi:hypothetical protein
VSHFRHYLLLLVRRLEETGAAGDPQVLDAIQELRQVLEQGDPPAAQILQVGRTRSHQAFGQKEKGHAKRPMLNNSHGAHLTGTHVRACRPGAKGAGALAARSPENTGC